jgi:hypothetical protein
VDGADLKVPLQVFHPLCEELSHVRQRRVDIQVRFRLPDFIEDEQRRILLITQHVVLDTAILTAAGRDVAAEKGFEFRRFFRLGLGMKNETVQVVHKAS